MNIKKGIIRRWHLLADPVVRFIASKWHRDKEIIVYGGALDLFIDNEKYIFIYNNLKHPEYKHIWLTRNSDTFERVKSLGFQVVKSNTIKGIQLILKAGTVVFDNRIDEFSYHNLSTGALRIEIWHGLPLKYFAPITNEDDDYYQLKGKLYEKYKKPNWWGEYCISTSSIFDRFVSIAFKIPKERIIRGTYPRVSILLKSEEERMAFIDSYETESLKQLYFTIEKDSRRKIIYMPTFRDADRDYISKAIPDWERLNQVLAKNSVVLYLKVHRVAVLPDNMNYSNIVLMDNSMDVYPLLPLFDMLITDYSSIQYDFSLMPEKKTVIYAYDIDEYRGHSRGIFKFFFKLMEELTVATTFEELLHIVASDYTQICRFPIERFYEMPDNNEALIGFINEYYNRWINN